jgi:hypothetical protein
MDGLFGAVVFIVIIIASIAQKIQEQRAAKRPGKALTREDIPEEARRRLYGDGPAEPKVATARSATATRPRGEEVIREAQPARRRATPPLPETAPGKELFNALFGGGQAVQQAEKPQPTQRRVPAATAAREEEPREVRVPPSRATQAATRKQQRKATASRQSQQVQSGDKATRRAKRETQRSARAATHTSPQPPSAVAMPRGPLSLFRSGNDVRRGIILAEILGPPKALQEGP